MAILQVEVQLFTEREILAIPLVIPLFSQPVALCGPRFFNLLVEKKMVPKVGTKKDRTEVLQDLLFPLISP